MSHRRDEPYDCPVLIHDSGMDASTIVPSVQAAAKHVGATDEDVLEAIDNGYYLNGFLLDWPARSQLDAAGIRATPDRKDRRDADGSDAA